MRNTRYLESFDTAPQAVIAIGNEYPSGHRVEAHEHRRSQLLYGASGAVIVSTEQGAWVVPPERAIWIPAGITHSLQMTLGQVSMRSIYVQPDAIEGLPTRCQVVGMPPLMRSLLQAAVDAPLDYDAEGRDGLLMSLLMHEIRRLPVLPLSLPFPQDPRLAQHCRRWLEQPTPHDTIERWSEAVGMSRRSFTRLFRRETGLSFAAWRQQACLFAALPRLAAGEAVTQVAVDLGYDSPAAFSNMFRRALGMPPSRYFATTAPA